MLVFEERGQPEYQEKNLSEQSREPTNSPTYDRPCLGIEPGPHWWEVSALSTAPALHPEDEMVSLGPEHGSR